MNQTIENFTRQTMKEKIARLPQGSHHRFKQMYAQGKLDTPIDEVIDGMPAEKLDWALSQIEATIAKAAKTASTTEPDKAK